MKLNLFAVWVRYVMVLGAVLFAAMFLVAAASGQGGYAVLALVACAVVLAVGLAVFGGIVRHDHRVHQETPHMF